MKEMVTALISALISCAVFLFSIYHGPVKYM